ncbi:MAG TPA: DegV family protein [Anaerolineae bacterium]
MPRITVVTDSDSSIPVEMAKALGIVQVPITIQFGNDSFESGVDIDDRMLFNRIDATGKLPTTAAPAAGRFVDAFQTAFDKGADSVVCFCVSSKVSASYKSACQAQDLLPERDIAIVDSNSLSMGQGYMAIVANEAAARGATKNEIIETALEINQRTHVYVALPTLKYLAMSGRVGYLTAGMANILSVKPILTIKAGKLEVLQRVRTQPKALARVVELAQQSTGGRPVERLAIVHVNAAAEAEKLYASLCSHIACPELVTYAELTPGLSVHAGNGVVGVVLVTAR